MGACASVQDCAEKERSDEIDRMIEEDSRKFRKECKILLLGELGVFFHTDDNFDHVMFVQARANRASRRS